LQNGAFLAMLPSSEVDAFEVQIEELLIAVHSVAREGLVAGATWRQGYRRMRPEGVPQRN